MTFYFSKKVGPAGPFVVHLAEIHSFDGFFLDSKMGWWYNAKHLQKGLLADVRKEGTDSAPSRLFFKIKNFKKALDKG